MPYTTREDVQQVLTPVTGQGRGGWSIPPEDVDHHILDAQAEIDTRLGARYAVPFADYPATPQVIREICQDIAAYLSALQAAGNAQLSPDSAVVRRYERKMRLLLDMQNGDADLPGTEELDDGAFVAVNTDRRCIPVPPWWS